jgi:hypothetical protein
MKYCPKGCIDFEIIHTNEEEFHNLYPKDYTYNFKEVPVLWDEKYPLISYIETPVVLFTEYLCYCGGLLGLWFGSNDYQVISYVMD